MKILQLQAENIKKLTAVEITPTGDVVTIAGKNAQGKSSILDAIWYALAGTSNIPSQPIRKGQQKARVRLDMGELIVERRFTESGTTVVVENAEGARYKSPQNMLDALLGALTFDPLAFARMEPRKQFDELRRITKIEVDIDKLDGLNRADYSIRTEINRSAKAKRAQADGVAAPEGDVAQVVDEAALVDQLSTAAESNAKIQAQKLARANALEKAEGLKKNSAAKAQRAAQMRSDAQTAFEAAGVEALAAYERAKAAAAETLKLALENADLEDKASVQASADAVTIETEIAGADALPEPTDVAALRQQIEQARATNKAIAEHTLALQTRRAIIQEAEAFEAKSQAITETMEARDKQKADAISAAQMPVEGLGFGNGLVTYNGVPFDQASSAEQLRVSLSIAMASNPKLRVIRIQDGSLLDDDSLAQIAAMAKEHDYQVWLEKVDSSGKVGIVIEDGAVKAIDGEPVTARKKAAA